MGQKISKEAARVATTKAPAAGADPITGFTRGAGVQSAKELEQREFLQRKATHREMPAELVKFMTDVGPLKPSNEVANSPRKPRKSRDGSRKVESMRLVENIDGFETNRTTSFSTKVAEEDPDDAGLDILQIYGHLSGKISHSVVDADHSPEQNELLGNCIKYLELPVLLKETSDHSYVGSPEEKLKDLLEAHKSMGELHSSQAKLVLDDLWEKEHA